MSAVQDQMVRLVEGARKPLWNVSGQPEWIDAGKWLPAGPHCVLATDLETHFIAVWDGTDWINAWTEEAIDSVITNWMELPEVPEA